VTSSTTTATAACAAATIAAQTDERTRVPDGPPDLATSHPPDLDIPASTGNTETVACYGADSNTDTPPDLAVEPDELPPHDWVWTPPDDQPAPPRPPGTHVQAPLDLPKVSPAALFVWLILVWHAGRERVCIVTRPTLQRWLGRAGKGEANVSRICRELEAAGMLRTTRAQHSDKTVNTYEPLLCVQRGDGRAYVDMSAAALAGPCTGRSTPKDVAWEYEWRSLARLNRSWTPERGGWTDWSAAQLAKKLGQSVLTVRRARTRLLALGRLVEFQRPGRRSLTAPPGELPETIEALPTADPTPPPTPINGERSPLSTVRERPYQPCHTSLPTSVPQDQTLEPKIKTKSFDPATAERTAVPREAGPSAAPDEEIISPVVEDPDAETPAKTHPSPRQKSRGRPARPPAASPLARSTYGRLPAAWRSLELFERRLLFAGLDQALTRYGPDAIVHAVTTYAAAGPLAVADLVPVDVVGLAVPALNAVLRRRLALDVKAGDCPACGQPRADQVDGCHAATRRYPTQPDPSAVATSSAADLLPPPDVCMACHAPDAPARPELPMPGSAVCDPCWQAVAADLIAELAGAVA
jgi:hypothetical protein